MNKIEKKNQKLTILKILNLNWLNLVCFKNTEHLNEFMQCINTTIQNAINNIFFVMLYSNMV